MLNGFVLPECAVCGRSVDELRWWDDWDRCQRILIARCHGQTEEVVLTDKTMVLYGSTMRFGKAFVAKALPSTLADLARESEGG